MVSMMFSLFCFAFCGTGSCNEKILVSDVVHGLIAALE